jgi:hypothetical protein
MQRLSLFFFSRLSLSLRSLLKDSLLRAHRFLRYDNVFLFGQGFSL